MRGGTRGRRRVAYSMGIPKDVGKYTQVHDHPAALVHYAALFPFICPGAMRYAAAQRPLRVAGRMRAAAF